MEETFRWIIGLIVACISAALAWLTNLVFADRREIAKLHTMVAVLQARPIVDPIKYTEATAEMATALTLLTKELQVLNQAQVELRDELRRIANDLDAVLRTKKDFSR